LLGDNQKKSEQGDKSPRFSIPKAGGSNRKALMAFRKSFNGANKEQACSPGDTKGGFRFEMKKLGGGSGPRIQGRRVAVGSQPEKKQPGRY